MRSNTSLLGTNLLWIASEMLEILTKTFAFTMLSHDKTNHR